MNRTDRLYALVETLRAARPGGRSSAWLAERFEISTRTVKRDMAALMEAGVSIEPQDGRGGGYRLARDANLPPLTFTAAEATAIAVALSADPQLPFSTDGRVALAKILGAMSTEQRAEANSVGRRVWVRGPEAKRPKAARELDEALRRHVVCIIDYEDGKGAKTTARTIEPMAFARPGGRWYLLAWCRMRKAGRWFRLDRVRKVRLTKEPVVVRGLKDVFGPPPDDARPVELSRIRT